MVYHGIIVKESLDEKIIRQFKIVGKKQGKNFFLLKIKVPKKQIRRTISLLQKNLKDKKYYAHFYEENELIIVFKDKIFFITPNKKSWGDAIEHGLFLGIPLEQLDFKPCRFEEETY